MSTLRTCLAVAVPLGLALAVLPAAPASAGDGVERAGDCTRTSTTKIKASHDDGRIELEGEVDSNRRGQTWRWSMLDGTTRVAAGTSTTVAPSGSFSVERRIANRAGTRTLTFRASNAATGERCTAVVRF